ncbi:hypothetical protein PV569_33860 [Streptomyces scabiei]|uniref:hypothetical protein n=1 Tax=Streptomyces scabiei TaxID=1930 RepID=UPI0029B39C89|nr:hypothetical protein [Streptomyces scabiei]MDX3298651.1 hypothetical protein [Streptomyces scabiei]
MPTEPDDDELAVRARLVALLDGPSDTATQPQPDAVDAAAAAAVAQSRPAAQPNDEEPDAQPQPQPDSAADPQGWWDALYADDSDTHTTAPDPAAQRDGDPDPGQERIPPWWSGRSVRLDPAGEDEADEGDDDVDESDDDPDAQPDAQPDADADDADDTVQPPNDPAAQPRKTRRPRLRSRAPRSRSNGYAAGPDRIVTAPAPKMSLLDAVANVPPRIRWLLVHGSAAAAGYAFGWVQYSTRTAAWIADNGLLNSSSIFWFGCAVAAEAARYRARHRRLPIRWMAAVPISSIVLGTALYGTGWQSLFLHLKLELPL